MSKYSVAVVGFVCLVSAVLWGIGRSDAFLGSEPLPASTSNVSEARAQPDFSSPVGPSWTSPTANQYYSVDEYRVVTIVDDTLVAGAWSRSEYIHTTSFDTTATTSNGKNELYFAGVADGGDCVIEKWRLKLVGMPGGGTTKIPARQELYQGLDLCPIRQIGADPEKRFMLVLSGVGAQGKLYSIPIQSSPTPTLLYAHSSTFPIGDMEYMERYQHTVLGRVWVLMRDPLLANGFLVDNTAIILVDSGNDSVFEDTIVGDAHALVESGVLGASTVLISYDSD